MNTLHTLIKTADAARKETKTYSSATIIIDNIGEVTCYRDYGVYKKGRSCVVRTNYKLNSKVISAANLAKLLT
jgi:hypothetical protein